MARTRAAGRVEEIAEAASRVFADSGYTAARMSDVAEAAGVSSGLLYSYAESKEALFHLAVQHAAGTDLESLSLPAPAPELSETVTLARRTLRGVGTMPALEAALETEDPEDVRAEVGAVVAQYYDGVNRYRRLLSIVERCARDWPDLAKGFYEKGRRPFVRRLGEYIERRVASGYFRPVPDADVAARFVIESVSWFANHRYGDYDGAQIPDDVARATVVQLVTAGLIGSP